MEGGHRPARVLQIRFHSPTDEFFRAQDHAAQRAALPVDVFCRRIDDDIGAIFNGGRKDRCGKNVVDNHRRTNRMSQFGNCFRIDHFQSRV